MDDLKNGDDVTENRRAPVTWCADLVERLRAELLAVGWENIYVSWDDEGEPEVIASWPGSGSHHVRLVLGEDRGHRYGFCFFGSQGDGGVQKDVQPDEDGLRQVVYDFESYRRVVDSARASAVEAESREAASLRAQLDRLVAEIGTSCDGETALQRARRLRELEDEVRYLIGVQNALGLRIFFDRQEVDLRAARGAAELLKGTVESVSKARAEADAAYIRGYEEGCGNLDAHKRRFGWVLDALGIDELPEDESAARAVIEKAIRDRLVEEDQFS